MGEIRPKTCKGVGITCAAIEMRCGWRVIVLRAVDVYGKTVSGLSSPMEAEPRALYSARNRAADAWTKNPGRPKLLITPIFSDFLRFFPFSPGLWAVFLDSWRPDAENGRKMGENG